jgi:hypothetical protein
VFTRGPIKIQRLPLPLLLVDRERGAADDHLDEISRHIRWKMVSGSNRPIVS